MKKYGKSIPEKFMEMDKKIEKYLRPHVLSVVKKLEFAIDEDIYIKNRKPKGK